MVDDCSHDSTPQILKKYQSKYGYELILHDNNIGLSATLTDVIKNYARGKYLTICASDDSLLPNKIESQVRFLQENPQYVMCYSRTIFIDENSEELSQKDNTNAYKSGYLFEDILCRRLSIGVNTMYRTWIFEKVGYYDPNVIAEDYYMYSKISKSFEIGFLDEYTRKYRVVEVSRKRDPWKLVMSHRQTIEMFREEPIYFKAVHSWEIQSAMIIAFYVKYKPKAIKFILKNLGHFISHPKDAYCVLKYLLLSWK